MRTSRGNRWFVFGTLFGFMLLDQADMLLIDPPTFPVFVATRASTRIVSTVCDVTLPEVRSTSVAIQNFVESVGAALSPLVAGLIAVKLDLRTAIVVICTSTWAVCALLFVGAIILVPRDIEAVRAELRLRAQAERTLSQPSAEPASSA